MPPEPGQRQKARFAQQAPDFSHLTLAADEAGQLERQIVCADGTLRCLPGGAVRGVADRGER